MALLIISIAPLHSQSTLAGIDQAIAAGAFTRAEELIQARAADPQLSPSQRWDLGLQADLLRRIRLDFGRDEAYVREKLAPYYPQLTDAQLRAWEATGELEMRLIDGERRYFNNAVWNLFRVNPAAAQRKLEVDGPRDTSLDDFLTAYLPPAVQHLRQASATVGNPRQFRLRYTLRVKPDAVPDGEILRAWLPYPRTDRQRLSDVALLAASEPNPIISPETQVHRSIYMEKKARAGEWTEFDFTVAYTARDEWHDLLNAELLPYDTASLLYKTYTAERGQHILFTPEIRELSARIVGTETAPLRKAWLIYQWIGENIPWASALEYSTMPNIPSYCIAHQRGDCGMKSLLYITLLRYNGIPAKWQSGWFLYPDNINLHDWAEVWWEGLGWVPMDPDFNIQTQLDPDSPAARFFFGGADAWRLIVNDDFGGDFYPAKVYPRSETVDFQRGEVEWRGGNLYFDQWRYKMSVEAAE